MKSKAITLLQIDIAEDKNGNAVLQYKSQRPVTITDDLRRAVSVWAAAVLSDAMGIDPSQIEVDTGDCQDGAKGD